MRSLPIKRLSQTAAINLCASIEADDAVCNLAVMDLMPAFHVKKVHQPLARVKGFGLGLPCLGHRCYTIP